MTGVLNILYKVMVSCLNKLQLVYNRLVYDTKMKVGVHRCFNHMTLWEIPSGKLYFL